MIVLISATCTHTLPNSDLLWQWNVSSSFDKTAMVRLIKMWTKGVNAHCGIPARWKQIAPYLLLVHVIES